MDGVKNQHQLCLVKYVLFSLSLLMIQGAPTLIDRERPELQKVPLEIKSGTSTPNKIIEGQPVELACNFSGWPLPHEVHWYRDGGLITNETEGIYHSEDEKGKDGEKTVRSTLYLPGREELEGHYKCSARNSIPSSASYEIQMIYECPLAKGIANHYSLEIPAPKSSKVSLSCCIDYDDICAEELLWKFNNKTEPLPASGKKYKVELKDTKTKCKKEFILSIFDVMESDQGRYSCYWLCEYENTTDAAFDLKVVDDLQTAGVIGRS